MTAWTVETLKDHYDARLAALETHYNERYERQRIAVDKAEAAMERRFQGVNEFRQALSDQTATYLRRDEYVAYHQTLVDKVDGMDSRLDRIEAASLAITSSRVERRSGVTSSTAVISVIVSVAVATMTLIALVLART